MEDMHFLVPSSTLLTLSLSLLELKDKSAHSSPPKDSSSFISQQRESDCFPFLQATPPEGDFLSSHLSAMEAEAMSHLATFHGGGAASDLQPQRSGWAWEAAEWQEGTDGVAGGRFRSWLHRI